MKQDTENTLKTYFKTNTVEPSIKIDYNQMKKRILKQKVIKAVISLTLLFVLSFYSLYIYYERKNYEELTFLIKNNETLITDYVYFTIFDEAGLIYFTEGENGIKNAIKTRLVEIINYLSWKNKKEIDLKSRKAQKLIEKISKDYTALFSDFRIGTEDEFINI